MDKHDCVVFMDYSARKWRGFRAMPVQQSCSEIVPNVIVFFCAVILVYKVEKQKLKKVAKSIRVMDAIYITLCWPWPHAAKKVLLF